MIAVVVVTVLIILYHFNITKHALLILVIFTIIILVLLEQSVLLINYVETAVFTTAWATKLLLTGLQTGDMGVIYSYVGWWALRKTEV